MSAEHKPLEELIEEYGELVRPISGVSMLPILRQNRDAVRLVKPNRELTVGDVPLYKRPGGQYVLHRIAGLNKHSYIIRGDNCVAFEKVPKSWVVAVADGFYRDGELISGDDAEYTEYVNTVLKKGRPFTADEYCKLCQDLNFKRLTTDMTEQGYCNTASGGGIKRLIKRLFPTFCEMKKRYPCLAGLPILLPFMWVWRLITCLFSYNKLRNAVSYAAMAFRKKH